MNDEDERAYWAAVATDFSVFLRQAFHTVFPGNEFVDVWYVDAIAHQLMRTFNGQTQRLMINLPPRHLKSFLVSVAWTAFLMGRDPSAQIICISYSEDLAKAFSRDCRRIIESPWYRRVFPNLVLRKATETELVTNQGGYRLALSVDGTITGRGADYVILDDPQKPEDARSERRRLTAQEWVKNTPFTRLNDKQRSVFIVVMQRLHVYDLTGYLADAGFEKLSLPAIATSDATFEIGEGEHHERLEGEVLSPEREPLEALERVCALIGDANFAAQYQQAPEAPEGALIKAKYLQYVDEHPPIHPYGYQWISIDAASSTAESADYSAITMGYSDQTGHYVRHADRGRWDFEGLLEVSLRLAKKIKDATFIVEAASAGISLIPALRRRGISVVSHVPKHDKDVRAALALPVFLAKRVFIVRKSEQDKWVTPFVNELLAFPNGRYDDQVDSLVQAIRWAERFVGRGWTMED